MLSSRLFAEYNIPELPAKGKLSRDWPGRFHVPVSWCKNGEIEGRGETNVNSGHRKCISNEVKVTSRMRRRISCFWEGHREIGCISICCWQEKSGWTKKERKKNWLWLCVATPWSNDFWWPSSKTNPNITWLHPPECERMDPTIQIYKNPTEDQRSMFDL